MSLSLIIAIGIISAFLLVIGIFFGIVHYKTNKQVKLKAKQKQENDIMKNDVSKLKDDVECLEKVVYKPFTDEMEGMIERHTEIVEPRKEAELLAKCLLKIEEKKGNN